MVRDQDLIKSELLNEQRAKVNARYKEYLSRFEPETPNDEQMLFQLAFYEVQMETMRLRLMETTMDADSSHTAVKSDTDALAKLVSEHQKIQDALGISYTKRSAEDDAARELPRVIHGAAEFLNEHAIFIRCPQCKAEEAEVDIRLGFILYHFRQDTEWRWECNCPRCNHRIIIDSETWKRDNPDKIIPPDVYIPAFDE